MESNILRVDAGGLPVGWITWMRAAELYCGEKVLWELGDRSLVLHGGIGRSGVRSTLALASIVATSEVHRGERWRTPVLTNPGLFARDRHLCLYCGASLPTRDLTRDHVIPRCQGGSDTWENTVAACRPCNARKGGNRPEEVGMSLLAVPYAPNAAEMLILSNRRILVDQMDYLTRMVPDRTERWL